MKTVENGHSVKLHYKGTFPDGEVFDDSRGRGQAMSVLVGNGQLIRGFESALIGMTEGEVKTINLTSEQAYGPVVEQAVRTAPKDAFPPDFVFAEGTLVSGRAADGRTVNARIVSFDDETVTLDHNHPLAGKDINFEIEVLEIDGVKNTKSFNECTVKELRRLSHNNYSASERFN